MLEWALSASRDEWADRVMQSRGLARDAPDQPGTSVAGAWFIGAFWDLSSERPIGMGMGQIPWSAIVRYGEWHGMERGMIVALAIVIRVLDGAYLKWHKSQQGK